MMPPGHVALTWGVAHLIDRPPATLDYRWLSVSALLPDLIDKPLAMLVFTQANASQLVAHSLMMGVVVLVLSLLYWRGAVPYALAFAGHLILDRMWHHTESFWWPFFGWNTFWEYKPMGSPEAMLNVYLDIITRYPQVWLIELAALGYLGWFALRHQLYRPVVLKTFLWTGHLIPAGVSTGERVLLLKPTK